MYVSEENHTRVASSFYLNGIFVNEVLHSLGPESLCCCLFELELVAGDYFKLQAQRGITRLARAFNFVLQE